MNQPKIKHPIKIRINNGTIYTLIDDSNIINGHCRNCSRDILLIVVGGVKMAVNRLEDDEYILHNLICPAIKYRK